MYCFYPVGKTKLDFYIQNMLNKYSKERRALKITVATDLRMDAQNYLWRSLRALKREFISYIFHLISILYSIQSEAELRKTPPPPLPPPKKWMLRLRMRQGGGRKRGEDKES